MKRAEAERLRMQSIELGCNRCTVGYGLVLQCSASSNKTEPEFAP